ncbi:MAG: hypothetical protein QM775_08645 [Pirellulales bacterium]
MREDLIGYLLGAMQPDEKRDFERRLQADAELRRELEFLKAALDECGDPAHLLDPPSGLAKRTCEFLSRVRAEEAAMFFAAKGVPTVDSSRVGAPTQDMAAARQDLQPAGFVAAAWNEPPAAGGRRWQLADVITLGGIAMAASLLFFPALASWRYGQHAATCRDKLHRLGTALVSYSDLHDGFFPEVPETGPLAHAGIYAPRLVEAKLVNDSTDFLCPGRPTTLETYAVPTINKLRRAVGAEEIELARKMGGGYGYALGYLDDGVYKPNRNLHRATFAVLADAPGDGGRGSLNHGCGGQNVLFEDGHAEFLSRCRLSHGAGDEIFQNTAGFVGAGLGPDDSVIAPSEARPLREPLTALK